MNTDNKRIYLCLVHMSGKEQQTRNFLEKVSVVRIAVTGKKLKAIVPISLYGMFESVSKVTLWHADDAD